jgi:hypothetical protein
MLANQRHVSASTHRQALSALVFLYREVIRVACLAVNAVAGSGARVESPLA